MARSAPIAPPPRVVTEAASTASPNIETPDADDPRYINFRVNRETFVEIKKAALDEGMKLGEYMVHAHRSYRVKRG